MPIWKAWRVAKTVSIYERQSILMDSAGAVIRLKNAAIESANKTIVANDSAYLAKENEVKECRAMDQKKDLLHKTELKDQRTKGRKEGGIVVGGIGLILLVLVL